MVIPPQKSGPSSRIPGTLFWPYEKWLQWVKTLMGEYWFYNSNYNPRMHTKSQNHLAQVRFGDMLETKREGIKVSKVSQSNEPFLNGAWHRRFVCIMSCISWLSIIWENSMFISFARCHGHELRPWILSIRPLRSISWHRARCHPWVTEIDWNSTSRRRTSTRSRSSTSFVPVSVSEKETWRQSMTEYDRSMWHVLQFCQHLEQSPGLPAVSSKWKSCPRLRMPLMSFCFTNTFLRSQGLIDADKMQIISCRAHKGLVQSAKYTAPDSCLHPVLVHLNRTCCYYLPIL